MKRFLCRVDSLLGVVVAAVSVVTSVVAIGDCRVCVVDDGEVICVVAVVVVVVTTVVVVVVVGEAKRSIFIITMDMMFD